MKSSNRAVAFATATAITGMGLVLSATASAETVLKFASFVSPKYVLHTPIFQKMANDVSASTGGQLKIRIYPSGELGKGARQQYTRAVRGVADITMGVTGYTSSLFPKTLHIEFPGVAKNGIDATAKMWKVMDKHLATEFKGTKVLALYSTAPSVILTTKKPIRSLADLKGMKIRTPSRPAGEVLRAYGASPVSMPATKLYTAMSTGVIDGVMTGPTSLLIWKLHEPANFATVGIPEMQMAIFIAMNRGSWNRLPAAQKAALAKASGKNLSIAAAKKLDAFAKKALNLFASKKGKTIIKLSAVARAEFDKAAAKARAKLVAGLEKNGVPSSQVIQDMQR